MKHTHFRTFVTYTILFIIGMNLYAMPALAAGGKAKKPASITVTSKAFKNGEALPVKYTLKETGLTGSENISPPLEWDVKAKTAKKIKSYAITVIDSHSIAKRWVHLITFNVPSIARESKEGLLSGKAVDMTTGKVALQGDLSAMTIKNSYGSFGYGGPKPPPGSGVHTYEITVYGLNKNVLKLNVTKSLSEKAFVKKIKKHIVASGRLTATFEIAASTEQSGVTVAKPPTDSPAPSGSPQQPPASSPTKHKIEITASGMTPASLTVKSGDTIEFTSKDGGGHWPASNQHPTHTLYPPHTGCAPQAFDSCRPIAGSDVFSFTFTHKGTWGFHDHLNPSVGGTIIVE